MNYRFFFFFFFLIFSISWSADWGFFAHKKIHAYAVDFLPKKSGLYAFFQANKEELVREATRPDRRRFRDKEEAYKHYINLEYFNFPLPKKWEKAVEIYTLDSLKRYGTAPWHIQQIYDELVRVMRTAKKDSVLYFAADLGHYLSDLHVPLHTTRDHDGATVDQNGIHSLWESVLPEHFVALVAAPRAVKKINISKTIWQILMHAHAQVPAVLAAERQISKDFLLSDSPKHSAHKKYSAAFIQAYDQAMHQTVQEQFDATVFHVASFWYTAYLQAGQPNFE